MLKRNFGQTLKLQSAVVTVNIRSKSLKYNYVTLFCLQIMYLCKFGAEKKPTGLEDRAKKRLDLQFFLKDYDLEISTLRFATRIQFTAFS